jgi:hypothetical protein
MAGDIEDFRPIGDPTVPPECLFTAGVTPESVRDALKCLDFDDLLRLGCRVIKHPNCCALCAANNDCTKIPLHVRCRCKPEFTVGIEPGKHC